MSIEVQRHGRWFFALGGRLGGEGGFAFFDEPPGGVLRLVVESRDHAPSPPVVFEPGTAGLVVILEQGARVAGSVTLPEQVRARDLRLVLRARTALGDPSAMRSAEPRSDGRFTFTGVPAGTYDLAVEFTRPRVELARIEDVEVEQESSASDPRLERIVLSERCSFLRVRVSRPDRGLQQGRLYVREPGERWNRAHLLGGEAVVPRFEHPLELVASAPGRRLVRLAGVVGDQEIVLAEPAIPVRLLLPASVTLPRVPLTIELFPPHDAPDASTPMAAKRYAFGTHEVTLELGSPGRYLAAFRVAGGEAIPATAPLFVEPCSAPQVHVVEPDPERYARAIERE